MQSLPTDSQEFCVVCKYQVCSQNYYYKSCSELSLLVQCGKRNTFGPSKGGIKEKKYKTIYLQHHFCLDSFKWYSAPSNLQLPLWQ